MTRWLQAARAAKAGGGEGLPPHRDAAKGVLSVKSVLSRTGEGAEPPPPGDDGREADMAAYAEFLRLHGPSTYGAAARDLSWGATRAWLAEARLRAAGRIRFNDTGRAVLVEDNSTDAP